MDHGKVIAQGSPAELIELLGADQIIEFSVKGDISECPFSRLSGVRSVRAARGTFALTVSDISLALPALMAEIHRQRAELVSLTTHQATLEDVFINLTGRRLRNGGS
jgi:ABC-2 type transport system ATP-binding protein